MSLNSRDMAHGVSGDRLRRLTHYITGALVPLTVFLSSLPCKQQPGFATDIHPASSDSKLLSIPPPSMCTIYRVSFSCQRLDHQEYITRCDKGPDCPVKKSKALVERSDAWEVCMDETHQIIDPHLPMPKK